MLTLIDLNIRFVPHPGGKEISVPGLACEGGLVMPLLWYFEAVRGKLANGTLEQIRHAFKLFIVYTTAMAPTGFGTRSLHGREHAVHFRRFRDAIVHGTIDERTLEDESGLHWPPGRVPVFDGSSWNIQIWWSGSGGDIAGFR